MKQADDLFEQYFAEKLWEMIPSIYRHDDGLEENPGHGVLRAIVEVMASQAAILRRSHDRLWEDQFIEFCSEWTVPYIADLVATRLLPLENKRGRRVDVARTIYYRRRKGTLRILEELIHDIAEWEGKAVENFRRLGRTRHGIDPHPGPFAGRFSQTPPGGWANLRNLYTSELAGKPFDEFHYTPDMRRHQGTKGRYNIPKLAFHLYRLRPYEIKDVHLARESGVMPFVDPANPERFTFDPSGRDIPLFARRTREESYNWEEWHSALEWELPAPVRCRLLGHAEYEITEIGIREVEDSPGLSALTSSELRSLLNRRFRNEQSFKATLTASLTTALSEGQLLALLHHMLVEDCGKKALLPASLGVQNDGTSFAPEQISAGNLEGWITSASSEKRLIIDPVRGRFMFVNMAPLPLPGNMTAHYHYGFSGGIGAGTYDRREVEDCEPTVPTHSGGGDIPLHQIPENGVLQIDDNKTYRLAGNKSGIEDLTIQAANHKRPYLRLENSSGQWVLETNSSTSDAKLGLNGLWIGASGAFEVILRGDYECVVISHCTLDPGGSTNIAGETIHPLPLVVEGTVEKMIIESSITGPVLTRGNGLIEDLIIRDSIIQSVNDGVPAIWLDNGKTHMDRVTVFGAVNVHRLFASETIFTGPGTVTDTQNGCFRFSAAPEESRLPHPYESWIFKNASYFFTSVRFGHPAYGQLSEAAPAEVKRGAENHSEMGAFSSAISSIIYDSLKVKVEEYMPFGLVPIFINET